MDQAAVAQVVQATVLEDLGTSLEPHSLAEWHAVLGQQLGRHAAQSAKHGPAGVDDLDLPVLGEGLGISGQTSCVPSVVSGELAGQVGGGVTLAEGACGSSVSTKWTVSHSSLAAETYKTETYIVNDQKLACVQLLDD